MGKISWELTAIRVARYAHEIRVPIYRAIDKLLEDANLDNATRYQTETYATNIVYNSTDSTSSDTRYLSVMKKLITQCLINLKKVNKTGDYSLDIAIVNFYQSSTGKRMAEWLIDALNRYDKTKKHNLVEKVDWTLPFTMLTGKDPNGDVGMFSQPVENSVITDINNGTISPANALSPGLVLRGTTKGIGEVARGTNSLPLREYTEEDGLSNGCPDPNYEANIIIDMYPAGIVSVPSIPPGTPNNKNYQQWIGAEPPAVLWDDARAVDERTTFQQSQWKTTLTPGTYKLMCECIVLDHSPASFIDLYLRPGDVNWTYPTVDLIAADNTVLVHKNVPGRTYDPDTDVLFSALGNDSHANTFMHEEIEFTITETTQVGLIPKLYFYWYYRNELYYRFYIVDSSVVATAFDDGTYSGVTAWEPYGSETVIHFTATNLLDNTSYTQEITRDTPLYDTDEIVVFTNNQAIDEALSEGIIKLDVQEKDEDNKSGSFSTVYLR